MPIKWTISRAERLVTVRAEGVISLRDVEALLDDIAVKEAIGYRKIFDARGAAGSYTDDDVMTLGARIQAYIRQGLPGAAAIVVDSQRQFNTALRIANVGQGKRPIRIFFSPEEARAWIHSNPSIDEPA